MHFNSRQARITRARITRARARQLRRTYHVRIPVGSASALSTGLGALLVFGAIAFAVDALASWYLMLGVGMLHAQYTAKIPPMGFWTSFLTVLTIFASAGIYLAALSAGRSRKS